MHYLHIKFLGSDWTTWFLALLISVTSFLLLRTIRHILIHRIGEIAKQTTTQLDDLFFELVQSTKVSLIVAVSFFLGAQLLTTSPQIDTVINKGIVLVLLIQSSVWGSNTITFFIERYVKKKASSDLGIATTMGLISFATKALLYSTIFLLTLSNFGINITALVAGLGVGGIAVALAAQNILGDLFASLTIVLDKPFIVGDSIVVGDFTGSIEHIGLKTTRLRSISGEQLIFANADLLQSRIRNYKRMNERRIVFNIRVPHYTPVDKLKLIPLIIREFIDRNALARYERCHFNSIGESSLNIETVYWVKSPEYIAFMDVQQELNLGILSKFKQEGIELAYPTQNLFLHSLERTMPKPGMQYKESLENTLSVN